MEKFILVLQYKSQKKDGEKEIDYKALSLILAEEVSDIKDQLLEKDYQITKIFERIERLSKMI